MNYEKNRRRKSRATPEASLFPKATGDRAAKRGGFSPDISFAAANEICGLAESERPKANPEP